MHYLCKRSCKFPPRSIWNETIIQICECESMIEDIQKWRLGSFSYLCRMNHTHVSLYSSPDNGKCSNSHHRRHGPKMLKREIGYAASKKPWIWLLLAKHGAVLCFSKGKIEDKVQVCSEYYRVGIGKGYDLYSCELGKGLIHPGFCWEGSWLI